MSLINNYTYINTATTTLIGPAAGVGTGRRVNLTGIGINKTLTGTLTVKTGATTIGTFAIGTAPNIFWWTADGGIDIYDLQLVTSAGDDITVFWNNNF